MYLTPIVCMALERNTPRGKSMGRPLGAVLLATGGAITLYNLSSVLR